MRKDRLKFGDRVLVYVPWSRLKQSDGSLRPYWEGKIVGILETLAYGRSYEIQRVSGDIRTNANFHERWVFPAKQRGKVRIVGKKNPRLVVR